MTLSIARLAPHEDLRRQFRASGIIVLDDVFPAAVSSDLQAQGIELDRLRAERADPELYWPWMARFQLGQEAGRVQGEDKRVPARLREAIRHNFDQDENGEQGLYFLYSYLLSCRAEEPTTCESDSVACRGRPSADCALCGVASRLTSEELRSWLREITGLSLSGTALSLSFTRFDADSFLSPHNDVSTDPDYELTFLYYANTPWPETWGGELYFQRGDGPVQRIAPRGNRLVVFEPTREARHWVPSVAAAAPRNRFAVAGWYLR
jgi:hypothetical protein